MLTREETDLLKLIHHHETAFRLLSAMFTNISEATNARWPKSLDCLELLPPDRQAIIKRIVLAEIDRERTCSAEILRTAVYAVEDHLKATATGLEFAANFMNKVDELQQTIQIDMATTSNTNTSHNTNHNPNGELSDVSSNGTH